MTYTMRMLALAVLLVSSTNLSAQTRFERARDAYQGERWAEAASELNELSTTYRSPLVAQRAEFLRAVALLKDGHPHEARVAFEAVSTNGSLRDAALFNAAVSAVYEGKPQDSYRLLEKIPDRPETRTSVLTLSALSALALKREALALALRARADGVLPEAEAAKLVTEAAQARDVDAWALGIERRLGAAAAKRILNLKQSIRTVPLKLWSTDFDLPSADLAGGPSLFFGSLALGPALLSYTQVRVSSRTVLGAAANVQGSYTLGKRFALRASSALEYPLSQDLAPRFWSIEAGGSYWAKVGSDLRLAAFLGYAYSSTFSTAEGYGFRGSNGLQTRLTLEIPSGKDSLDLGIGYGLRTSDGPAVTLSNRDVEASLGYRFVAAYGEQDVSIALHWRQLALGFSNGDVRYQVFGVRAALHWPDRRR